MVYDFWSEMMGKKSDQRTERIFYTFKEAMDHLAVSSYTLRKLMKSGLPSHRIGKKIVFLKEDVAMRKDLWGKKTSIDDQLRNVFGDNPL